MAIQQAQIYFERFEENIDFQVADDLKGSTYFELLMHPKRGYLYYLAFAISDFGEGAGGVKYFFSDAKKHEYLKQWIKENHPEVKQYWFGQLYAEEEGVTPIGLVTASWELPENLMKGLFDKIEPRWKRKEGMGIPIKWEGRQQGYFDPEQNRFYRKIIRERE